MAVPYAWTAVEGAPVLYAAAHVSFVAELLIRARRDSMNRKGIAVYNDGGK